MNELGFYVFFLDMLVTMCELVCKIPIVFLLC